MGSGFRWSNRSPADPVRPLYFESAAACRRWLEANHASAAEALFGFYRRDTGRGGITYSEALDQALCFGWIDGVRRKFDELSYVIRFTPRRPKSKWSRVNLARAQTLITSGAMAPPGRVAFDQRLEHHPIEYSYEQAPRRLPPEWRDRFTAKKRAWTYFEAQPPNYRRLALHWVMTAKQEATRKRRLEQLIACSTRGEWIPPMRIGQRKKK